MLPYDPAVKEEFYVRHIDQYCSTLNRFLTRDLAQAAHNHGDDEQAFQKHVDTMIADLKNDPLKEIYASAEDMQKKMPEIFTPKESFFTIISFRTLELFCSDNNVKSFIPNAEEIAAAPALHDKKSASIDAKHKSFDVFLAQQFQSQCLEMGLSDTHIKTSVLYLSEHPFGVAKKVQEKYGSLLAAVS